MKGCVNEMCSKWSFFPPPPMVTFACFWRSDFMLWNTFKFIITIYIAITLCLEIVLNDLNFTMLNTACCVRLLFGGTGNTLCLTCYNIMMLPVPCNVCMTVLLYFLHHCLVCCLCSLSFFQPPVFVQLISQTIFQYVVLIQNVSIFVTFVCMVMINSFLFLVGLALYSLWAHIFALCPKPIQLIWIFHSYALCSLCIPCTRVYLETIWT